MRPRIVPMLVFTEIDSAHSAQLCTNCSVTKRNYVIMIMCSVVRLASSSSSSLKYHHYTGEYACHCYTDCTAIATGLSDDANSLLMSSSYLSHQDNTSGVESNLEVGVMPA